MATQRFSRLAATGILAALTLVSAATLAQPSITVNPSTVPGPIGKAPPSLAKVVQCPATLIAQATNAASPWLPGAVQMSVVGTGLTSGATPQMMCKYAGSGSQWSIYRNIAPEFKTCAPLNNTAFSCSK